MSYVPNPRPTGDIRTNYRDDSRLFQTLFEARAAIALVATLIVLAPFMGDIYNSQLIVI
jgi:branched-chain amino acid transport system permease protein